MKMVKWKVAALNRTEENEVEMVAQLVVRNKRELCLEIDGQEVIRIAASTITDHDGRLAIYRPRVTRHISKYVLNSERRLATMAEAGGFS